MLRGSPDVAPVDEDYPFTQRDVFDRPAFPRMHFVERRYASDPTNWWIPNRACAEAMLRSAGFSIVTRAEDEVYLCAKAAVPEHVEPPPRIATGGEVRP
jgi:tRNA (mo5U34)-methyltransferase